MKRNTNLVTFGGKPVTLMGRLVKPGQAMKNFTAMTQDLQPFTMSKYQNMVRVISSVPSVDTDTCAMQTRRFNKEADDLATVQLITVSCDLPFALKRFCAVEGIDNIITVSDQKDKDFGIKYGLLIEELGLLARAVIVIDADDVVKYVEVVKEVAHQPDYEKALAVIKKLI
ncbi:MAG: thiol peroxidase [Bacteroidales bacterium]|nr:thiol peroxidase [Bacteroidales bacterium]